MAMRFETLHGDGITVVVAVEESKPVQIAPPAVTRGYVRSYTGRTHGNGEPVDYMLTFVHEGVQGALRRRAIACTCPDYIYRHRVCKHMADHGCHNLKGRKLL